MPIAITMFKGRGEVADLIAQENRAHRITLILKIIFLAMTSGWLIASVITGDKNWRLSISIVFCYQTIVFLVSLLKIRSLISEVKTPDQFKPNHCLLILNLLTFIFEALTYGASFAFGLLVSSHKENCLNIEAYSFSYDLLWLNILMRCLITSYMNIKFSHSL